MGDGKFNDGAEHRQFGFGRFNRYLRKAKGADELKIALSLKGKLDIVRIYNRALLTSEIIQNYRFENGKQGRYLR